jgi:hypothetical protein
MRIDKQDLYHGAALMQIVEHSQAIIMKMKHKSSEYQVSVATAPRGEENRYIYIKHVARNVEPFRFVFSKQERDFLEIELTRNAPVFVVLVCGSSYICALSKKQYRDLAAARGPLTLLVEAPPGGSMRVRRFGSDKKPLLVAHNTFPKKVVS